MEKPEDTEGRPLLIDQTRSLSDAYRLGTSTAIENVLLEIDLEALKRVKSGFNELTFTLGVLNSFFVLYVFTVFPQHFWLLYLAEALLLFPSKIVQSVRAVPNGAFYLLDFCWIVNFFGTVTLLVLIFGAGSVPHHLHEFLFLAAYGVSCGPLLAANIVLPFLALVFHDVGRMTDLFLHFYPPLLLYVLRWRSDEVLAAWPGTFDFHYDDVPFFPRYPETPLPRSVLGATALLYASWLVPYAVWQLASGLDLPRRTDGRFDTVYHSAMRRGACVVIGRVCWGRPVEVSEAQVADGAFETRDFVACAAGHAAAVAVATVAVAYPCTRSRYVHGGFLGLCTVICAWRGARMYTYYSTEMYAKLVKGRFAAELERETGCYGSVDAGDED